MRRPPTINAAEADAARASAQKVVDVHRRLGDFLRPGMTLAHIDAFVARTLEEFRCRSCFLGYRVGRSPAFPSHACLSVNDCVVHGTAGSYLEPMRAGDILKIDIGVTFRGWIGDAAWTYVFAPKSDLVDQLTACGKESIRRGVAQLRPGKRYLDWARVVQQCVEGEYGFRCVEKWGGHGYGRKLHAPPHILNMIPASLDEWGDGLLPCEPGTLVAVEPMIAVGTGETVQNGNEWPVYTADRSLSVHYEHDVLITSDGPEILTTGLEEVPDVIG